jgi:hypothetical protein
MTRIDTIAALNAANTLAAARAALKAADAYTGMSRASKADMIAKCRAVAADLAAADKPASKGRQVNVAAQYVQDSKARRITAKLTAKWAAVVANAASDADGVLTVTADDLTAAGIGVCWLRRPDVHVPGTHAFRTFAAVGYTAAKGKGCLVLTPAQADAVAA